MYSTFLAAMVFTSSSASAGMVVEGDRVAVTYGDGGTWTDYDESACMSMLVGDSWRDFCWAGTPFQTVAFKYNLLGITDVEHIGSASGGWSWDAASLDDLSGGGTMIASLKYLSSAMLSLISASAR